MATTAEGTFSVRDRQAEALLRMLRMGAGDSEQDAPAAADPAAAAASAPEVWKVLVFDSVGSDVVSLLLRVGDIRRCGITLTMRIESERQAIADAPAVYLVSPTRENILQISRDCRAGLYDSFYLNFTSSVPAPLLEELAATTLQFGCAHRIQRVYDAFSSFMSLEPDLFVTGFEDSYIAFNDPTVSDEVARAYVARVAESLFSVVTTMRVLPIIRAPKNTAAELVAQALNEKLQELLKKVGGSAFSSSFHRPLMVILERNIDLSVMFSHPWTYRALVHELLDFNMNRVKLTTKESGKDVQHSFDLDCTQRFWSQHCGSPFPSVAVEVQNEVTSYKATVDEINKLAGTMGVDIERDLDQDDSALADKGLTKFVGKLPMLRETKKAIDTHTTLATALLEQIKARELDAYFFTEENLMSRSYIDPKEVLAILTKPKAGSPDDNLRLFLIYYLTAKNPPVETVRAMEQALAAVGVDPAPLIAFIRKARAFTEGAQTPVTPQQSSHRPTPSASGWGAIGGMFEKMYGIGVRALQPKSTNFYVTRVVDALMDLRGAHLGIEDSYIYLDPKITKGQAPRKTTPFNDGIVFVIGGGNYVEHQNLMDYCKRTQPGTGAAPASAVPLGPTKRVIYGTTEILHPSKFIRQMTSLGTPLAQQSPSQTPSLSPKP